MASARHGARGQVLIPAGVVLLGLCVAAQTTPSSPNAQKITPPPVSPPEGRKGLSPGGQGSGPVEILSDTMGVDFNPYLQRVFRTVNLNWRILMPESVYPPILKKGIVFIEFSVMKDGSLQGMKVVGPPADVALARAAWGSITNSAPFEPLPSEFKGQYLQLRFKYFYNLNVDGTPATDVSFGISPPGPITVAAGGTRQFSARARAGGMASVNWAISGDQCGERWDWTAVVIATKSECGDISTSGLYSAPDEVPERPEVVITATSVPLKSATTKVSIVAPSSAK
jgi:hypothetical protein